MLLAAAFALLAGLALLGLWLLDPRTVPPISGTCALILTVAALAVAIVR
ncbi:hypothetical protein ABZ904_08600 [Streptomyces sp. NPDC046900]